MQTVGLKQHALSTNKKKCEIFIVIYVMYQPNTNFLEKNYINTIKAVTPPNSFPVHRLNISDIHYVPRNKFWSTL